MLTALQAPAWTRFNLASADAIEDKNSRTNEFGAIFSLTKVTMEERDNLLHRKANPDQLK